MTEKDRDIREKTLWDEFYVYSQYIKKQNLPEAELIVTYSAMMELFKDLFSQCREINAGLENTLKNGGKELELIKTKIEIDPARANNKEMFYTKDLKTIFDLSLDQFNLISVYSRDIVNYDIGESDKMPKMDIERFTNNATNLVAVGQRFTKMADELQDISDNYKSKLILDAVAKENKGKEKKIYYTFDGREYKTLRGRNNYEQRLAEKYNKIFDLVKDDVKDPQDIEKLKYVVSESLNLLKETRTFNDLLVFLENDELKKKAKKEFPTIDFTPYTARNKEICHIKDIYDAYDPLLGIFEIQANVMEYLEKAHKENIKTRNNGESATISLTINVDENKDFQGITHSELFDKAIGASKKLSSIYPKLIAFYQKEKQRMGQSDK
ncbi:hypothetical protein [Dysgonomonas sp. 511]|uniref:hypothetical protein n=1 Tax=Dysgonomonas sp. 511 TaxID=2302930 RepID=UPI0013D1CCED|nr:hypothetical protein [Dysgonomonas sp. 511]